MQVPHNTPVGHLKNGRHGIPVYGHNVSGIHNPRPMLNGPGYTAGDIKLGPHRLPGLTHLSIRGNPPFFHRNTGTGHLTPQDLGQIFQDFESTGVTNAPATGHDNFGLTQITRFFGFPDNFKDSRFDVLFGNGKGFSNDISFFSGLLL